MRPIELCRFLRNKAFYFTAPPPGAPGEEAVEPRALSTPCWCFETHEPIGPDGGDVHESCCVAGRGCFRASLES